MPSNNTYFIKVLKLTESEYRQLQSIVNSYELYEDVGTKESKREIKDIQSIKSKLGF